jgi:hypothetical protein
VNGGFNAAGINGWSLLGSVNFTTYGAGDVAGTNPYEGTKYAATNTGSGGSFYQDIPETINTGDTYCASAEFVTDGNVTGAGGTLSLYLTGGSGGPDGSNISFNGLPGKNNWTPESTCVTATSARSDVRVQVYPQNNTPTLAVDAIDTQARGFGVNYPAPKITTTKLPQATVGRSYSTVLLASGGASPYTWAVSSGSLPHGLSLSSTGKIHGKPTKSGTSSFTVTLTDHSVVPELASQHLKLKVDGNSTKATTGRADVTVRHNGHHLNGALICAAAHKHSKVHDRRTSAGTCKTTHHGVAHLKKIEPGRWHLLKPHGSHRTFSKKTVKVKAGKTSRITWKV